LIDRQVALPIVDNKVFRAISVSTGKPSTPTPPGNYRVDAKIQRWWSVPFREWLPWAVPFVGGIAFHEFGVVPIYPASTVACGSRSRSRAWLRLRRCRHAGQGRSQVVGIGAHVARPSAEPLALTRLIVLFG
jgi:L,D-transpeptidase catalytic domain